MNEKCLHIYFINRPPIVRKFPHHALAVCSNQFCGVHSKARLKKVTPRDIAKNLHKYDIISRNVFRFATIW